MVRALGHLTLAAALAVTLVTGCSRDGREMRPPPGATESFTPPTTS